MMYTFKLTQRRPWELWGPKFYIGCIRIDFRMNPQEIGKKM